MELIWALLVLIVGGGIGWMSLIALYVTYTDSEKFPPSVPLTFFGLMLLGWFGSLLWAGILVISFFSGITDAPLVL